MRSTSCGPKPQLKVPNAVGNSKLVCKFVATIALELREFYSGALRGVKTPEVQGWLIDCQGQRTTVRREKLRARVAARMAERMARKARVEALMQARNAPQRPGIPRFGTGGVKVSTWKSNAQKEKEAEEARRVALEAKMKAEEARLRQERVAHLEALRAPTRFRRQFGCFSVGPRQ